MRSSWLSTRAVGLENPSKCRRLRGGSSLSGFPALLMERWQADYQLMNEQIPVAVLQIYLAIVCPLNLALRLQKYQQTVFWNLQKTQGILSAAFQEFSKLSCVFLSQG